MIIQNRQAFTLIEMLIVIAMIGIMAAGLIAYVTVPMGEQLQATTDMENEQGLGTFFAKLTSDAHNASGLILARDNRALVAEESGPDASAVYFVDRRNRLRRTLLTRQQAGEFIRGAGDPPAAQRSNLLVENVRRFEAAPLEDGGMWRVSVCIATGDPLHPELERRLDLAVGNPAARSGRQPDIPGKSSATGRQSPGR